MWHYYKDFLNPHTEILPRFTYPIPPSVDILSLKSIELCEDGFHFKMLSSRPVLYGYICNKQIDNYLINNGGRVICGLVDMASFNFAYFFCRLKD